MILRTILTQQSTKFKKTPQFYILRAD